MKLVDLKVNEYLDVLKSDVPAPGGGSVSALAGAQGAGPRKSPWGCASGISGSA